MTDVRSHLQGTIVRIDVAEGDAVRVGQQLAVIESMKMEHPMEAEAAGVVVAVRVAVGDGLATVTVDDDGPGIAPEALPRVFEPGWSTKPSTETAQRGIGLALVAATAARLGGSATAANDGGAVFTVRLPVRDRQETPS